MLSTINQETALWKAWFGLSQGPEILAF
jgi:hypothetical protein